MGFHPQAESVSATGKKMMPLASGTGVSVRRGTGPGGQRDRARAPTRLGARPLGGNGPTEE
jgi:hypothetical protein